jgi:delta8-fatty-acid desaturase
MKAYRIGRVQLPWTNMEPPIRAGSGSQSIAMPVDDEPTTISDSDSLFSHKSEGSSNSSVVSDNESEPEKEGSQNGGSLLDRSRLRQRKPVSGTVDPSVMPNTLPVSKMSRSTFAAVMEQKEIADGIRNYPSLDIETQEAIRVEYEKLHQVIQEKGYYTCSYSQYGKESIRYSILFATFLYLLHSKWYLTSAACLGLFWVSLFILVFLPIANECSFTATNHVRRSRRWSPWHHW